MKVLLIEDNTRLIERIKYHLKPFFIVDTAINGESGLDQARRTQYKVILLDLNLPDIGGQDICEQLRKEGVDTPIIVISGTQDSDSRITLLNCGADDFLVKPFNPTELVARIHSIMRRYHTDYNQHIVTIKDLTVDINRRKVNRSGDTIQLRKKEFDILEYLIANQGHPVTRSMILNHVWDSNEVTWQKTIDVHIKYLRDKVDRPYRSALIKTAYGVGYMIDDTI
jgi:two-component system copper resistance phosphate regulon response regulator CusR